MIKVGQIWQETDKRFDRKIIVKRAPHEDPIDSLSTVCIRSVVKSRKGVWEPAPRSRDVYAKAIRFNGKAGGYELVDDIVEGKEGS